MEAQRVDFWEAPDCTALSPEVISSHILSPLGLSVGLYSAAASSAAHLLFGGAQRCPRKDTENFPHRGKRNPWQLLQPPPPWLPAASSEQLPLPARGFTAPCSPQGLFIGGFIFAFPHPHVFLPAQSCYSRPLISRQRSPPPNPAARVQLPDVETSSRPRGN